MKKRVNISQFSGIRVIALYGIMLYHTNEFFHSDKLSFLFYPAAIGLYLCFIMSGFLYGCNHWDNINSYSIKDSVKLYLSKFKKFYPIHFITFLLDAFIVWKYLSISSIFTLRELSKIVLNLLLLQVYIPDPDYYFSYNGVSWFLAITLLLYFFAPFFVWALKKSDFDKNAYKIILGVVALYLLVSIALGFNKYSVWILNNSPLHLFDFLIGIILGRIFYLKKQDNDEKSNINVLLVCTIMLIGIAADAIVIFATQNDMLMTVAASLASGLILYGAANSKGIIAAALNNKVINFLSLFSLELFMLHQIVGKYMMVVHNKFQISNLICYGITVVVSIVASYVLHIIIKKMTPSL